MSKKPTVLFTLAMLAFGGYVGFVTNYTNTAPAHEYVIPKFTDVPRTKDFNIDMKLRDNQIIRRYGLELKIVSLPGHTNGSIGILYKDYLFAGDALINRWHGVEVAFQNQIVKKQYFHMKRLKRLIQVLYL